MSLLRKLEEKLEGIFERAFTKALRKKIEPIELANELERKVEETAVTDVTIPYAANVYHIMISRSDYSFLKPYERELKAELEDFVAKKAESLGVVLLGKPSVIFKVEQSLKAGDLKIVPQVKKDEFSEKMEALEQEKTKVIPVQEAANLNLQAPYAIIENLTTGSRHHVMRFPYRIGRMEANNLVLDDQAVSRFHAEIYDDGKSYLIRDLESTNGTFVNGKLIRVRKLNPGDVITVGNTKLRWLPNR
ncbi:MAG: FHA domain-containing protein [Actinobacteria bacterium]|nr:FHA domain-containing protein [Actinomycetota bacterium]